MRQQRPRTGLRPGRASRERGVALMLVVVALAVASILALPFLASQTTSTAIGRNIADHGRARAVAESGLELALAYIEQDADWRQSQPAGVWLDDHDVAGGTVTVTAANEDDEGGALGDIVVLTSVGRVHDVSHTARVRVEGSPANGSIMPYGLNVAERVEMDNEGRVDALDSRSDAYHPDLPARAEAVVASNTTGSEQVSLNNSARIDGDVLVGPGGNPGSVVRTKGSASVTGSLGNLAEPLDMPSVSLPANLPPSAGNSNFPNQGSQTLSAGTHRYDDFQVQNDFELRIDGDVTIVAEDFKLDNAGRVTLAEGATLTVYARKLMFNNESRLNYTLGSAPDPTAATLYALENNVQIDNAAIVAAAIIAPDADLQLQNDARLFGGFVGRSAKIQNSARLTQDHALTGGPVGGDGDGAGDGYVVRWLGPAP